MQMQMPGSFMPSQSMMEHLGGAGGLPPGAGGGGMKDMHHYYNMNMVDNGGHFYPQMPPSEAEQYHAMMNGMGAMRDMSSYYNMNMMNQSDPNMMNPNGHF